MVAQPTPESGGVARGDEWRRTRCQVVFADRAARNVSGTASVTLNAVSVHGEFWWPQQASGKQSRVLPFW